MAKKKFTDEELSELHNQGLNDTEISEELGVTQSAVTQRRNRLDLKSNSPRRKRTKEKSSKESLGEDEKNWVRLNVVVGKDQKKRWREYIKENKDCTSLSDFVRTACEFYVRQGGSRKTVDDIKEEISEHLAEYFESLSKGIEEGRPYLHYKVEEKKKANR